MTRQPSRAFTLVELLVVIAIIGILVALLLPAVQAAREAARRMSCVNNLTQLVLAIQGYESSYRVYPPGTVNPQGPIMSVSEGMHHNWLTKVLPYMEDETTYNHIDFSVSVYDPKNEPVRKVRISLAVCPSDPGMSRDHSVSSYAAVHHDVEAPIDVDQHGVFFLNSAVRYEQVSDGAAYTLFLGEKLIDSQRDLGWMSGTRWTLRNTGRPINTTSISQGQNQGSRFQSLAIDPIDDNDPSAVGGFASYHPGGMNAGFGDGHVGFVTGNLDLEVLQQLGHRADGQLRKEF